MGDLSSNFSRSEFACSCYCGCDTVDYELIQVLEETRRHFDAPIKVTSGHRCAEHNRAIGGSKNSQHVKGRAADIQIEGVDPSSVQDYLKVCYPNQYGIGSYDTFTHIDTRTDSARWDG